MTIGKAIDDIELILKPENAYLAADKPEALRLGIEALKYVQDIRHIINTPNPELLPGETKGQTPYDKWLIDKWDETESEDITYHHET